MSKNLISEVAKMLDVELDEEFKVVSKDGSERNCKITHSGLSVSGSSYSKRLLADIVCGDVEVVKLPWEPKEDDFVWTFHILNNKLRVAIMRYSKLKTECLALYKIGWIFRTFKEAEAALPAAAEELNINYEYQKKN